MYFSRKQRKIGIVFFTKHSVLVEIKVGALPCFPNTCLFCWHTKRGVCRNNFAVNILITWSYVGKSQSYYFYHPKASKCIQKLITSFQYGELHYDFLQLQMHTYNNIYKYSCLPTKYCIYTCIQTPTIHTHMQPPMCILCLELFRQTCVCVYIYIFMYIYSIIQSHISYII